MLGYYRIIRRSGRVPDCLLAMTRALRCPLFIQVKSGKLPDLCAAAPAGFSTSWLRAATSIFESDACRGLNTYHPTSEVCSLLSHLLLSGSVHERVAAGLHFDTPLRSRSHVRVIHVRNNHVASPILDFPFRTPVDHVRRIHVQVPKCMVY